MIKQIIFPLRSWCWEGVIADTIQLEGRRALAQNWRGDKSQKSWSWGNCCSAQSRSLWHSDWLPQSPECSTRSASLHVEISKPSHLEKGRCLIWRQEVSYDIIWDTILGWLWFFKNCQEKYPAFDSHIQCCDRAYRPSCVHVTLHQEKKCIWFHWPIQA